jgi:hypothetical protein
MPAAIKEVAPSFKSFTPALALHRPELQKLYPGTSAASSF